MSNSIKLVVGLGNPGQEYAATRHNAGFQWLDQLTAAHQLTFHAQTKFHGHVARLTQANQDIHLLKPQTFMNLSGRAVLAVAQFYKIEAAQILVVHDELDLPPGSAKLKLGGGHGGHNGLKDIITHLGSKEFWRLRLGVGHPGDRAAVVNYVLNAPRQEEQALIDEAMQRAHAVSALIFAGNLQQAMLKLHRATP